MGKQNRFYDRELDKQAVERIITASGLDGTRIDRDELSIDLPTGRAICVSGKHAVSPAVAKHNAAKFTQLRKVAAKLKRLLEDSEVGRDILLQMDLRKGDPRASLKNLISTTDHILASTPAKFEKRFENFFLGRSEFENLAGVALPNIFEQHFHRPATILRKEDQADGPFIRFAYQALIELDFTNNGRPYSREAIAKALTLARSGRNRRNWSPKPVGQKRK